MTVKIIKNGKNLPLFINRDGRASVEPDHAVMRVMRKYLRSIGKQSSRCVGGGIVSEVYLSGDNTYVLIQKRGK